MNLDCLYSKKYNFQTYNCAHFAVDVWKFIAGKDISSFLLEPSGLPRVPTGAGKGFKRLAGPVSPCLAVFRGLGGETHVGVFLDGRILHIVNSGVVAQPVDRIKMVFRNVRFYSAK